jgi:thiamine pyrophosphate-dependent acetolactate synthase large subunit-like protein
MDCLIVIGTNLDSNIANFLGNQAALKNTIIEINPRSMINMDNIPKLLGDIEDTVTRLCKLIKTKTEEYLKKLSESDVD